MSSIPEKAQWPGWETVRLIGRGSFGGVYEIQRKIFDETETAALKVISVPQSSGDIDELYSVGYDEESITEAFKDQLKGIVNEYSLMRKLNGCHNIVSCDDVRYVQQDNGYGWDIYIKMELLTPLLKALPARIPEQTVIQMAKDLCSALDWCKRYNIIHRDIKPQNIFVSEAGEYKLGDFGIAKTVEKTSGGTRIGTYKYIAPEVFFSKPYGSAADIYSLGLTLYWMLNERRMPFLPLPPTKLTVGAEEEARQRRLSGQPLPDPWNGSEKLKAIVLKACAYKPEDRYQSAREMLEDLEALDAPASRPMAYAPAEAAEADTEGTALLDGAGQTALLSPEEEQTGLLTPEEEPQEKPYGFVEGTVLMEEDDTLLMPQEDAADEMEQTVRPDAPEKKAQKPVTQAENSVKPTAEAPKEPEKPAAKKRKKSIFGPVLMLVALIMFAMMVCGVSLHCLFFGHSWTPATRTTAATCRFCGETTGTSLEPTMTAKIEYCSDGINDPTIRSWDSGVNISCQTWRAFPQSTIQIFNANNEEIPANDFDIRRYGDGVSVEAKENLQHGLYLIIFSGEDEMLSVYLCYGYKGDIYLFNGGEHAWGDAFALQNWKTKEYLAQDQYHPIMMETYRTYFKSSAEICGVLYDDTGKARPYNDCECVPFKMTTHFVNGDEWTFVRVFEYEGLYLAADDSVYFSSELTEECYWVLVSGN